MMPLRFSLLTDKPSKVYINNPYIHEIEATDFQAFVAPETFIKPTQFADFGLSLNIYQIYKDYSNPNKKYIYEFTSAIATLTLPVVANVTYRYGETISGVDYVTEVSSGTAFTEGSTKRYVIVNSTSATQLTIILPLGSIWAYLSNKIKNCSSRNNTYIKYVFCQDILSITEITFSSYRSCPNLEGSFIISEAVIALGTNLFDGSTKVDKLIFKSNITTITNNSFIGSALLEVYMYPIIAPICISAFGIYPSKKLHIKAGATGYDVPQWTTTAVFSQIIQDL